MQEFVWVVGESCYAYKNRDDAEKVATIAKYLGAPQKPEVRHLFVETLDSTLEVVTRIAENKWLEQKHKERFE